MAEFTPSITRALPTLGWSSWGGARNWGIPNAVMLQTGTFAYNANEDNVVFFWVVGRPIQVDGLACEVTTGAAGNVRLGLTALDKTMKPIGAPLVDSGDISTSTTGVKTHTFTPITLQPGVYGTMFNKSSTATMRFFDCTVRVTLLPNTWGVQPYSNWASRSRTYAPFTTPTVIDTPPLTAFNTIQHGYSYAYVLLSVSDAG